MIAPMKKVAILVMDQNKEEALEQIRELGVVHLDKKPVAPSSPALTKLADRCAQIDAAWGILYGFSPKKKPKTMPPEFEGDLASHVIALSERRKKLQDYMCNHQREIGNFEKWGEFDPNDFAYLADNGVNAHLYEISLESYEDNVVGDVPVIVLAIDKKNHHVRLLAFGEIPNEKHWPMPNRPLSVTLERNVIRNTEYTKIEAELTALSPLKTQLEAEKKRVLADIEFETARAGMELIDEKKSDGGADLSVSWLSGYMPVSDMETLKRTASENNWAFCAADPAEDDTAVPTKLVNNKLVSTVYPVLQFLDLAPGYREKDISGWFLLFLALFFGMIFGDAAYGAILLTLSIALAAKTAKTGVPLFVKFLFIMSVSNFVWGVLTGTWFGLDIAQIPELLQNISLPLVASVSAEPGWLASYNAGNFWISSGLVAAHGTIEEHTVAIDVNLKLFCFSIALVHLGLAHVKRTLADIKSPKALAQIGHLGMLVSMYFVVLSMIVYNAGFSAVKFWQIALLGVSFILVFVFANYKDSILDSIITSCKDIMSVLLSIPGAFSDIMSYIRLWAMALAGASISSTVNGFALPMFGSVFLVLGIILFALGHLFNIVLNGMSFLVHGVRLNTLEFSSHMGLEWSGFLYKPFAKRQ